MNSQLHLIVVGGGIIEWDQAGKPVGKAAIVRYLHELSGKFRRVTWVATTSRGQNHTSTSVDLKRVGIKTVRGKPASLLSDYRVLSSVTDRSTVLILHLPRPWLVLPVIWLRGRARLFVVYVANDYMHHARNSREDRTRTYSFLYRKLCEIPIKLADGVIARGSHLREISAKLNSSVIETSPLIALPAKTVPRKTPPCEDQQIQILYVGKIVRSKGIEVLLEAVSRLASFLGGKSLLTSVVGSGPDLDYFQNVARSLKIDLSVSFTEWVDDPHAISSAYASADLVVVPSLNSYPEGVPRVITEALMHDAIVVASKVGGIPREFTKGEIVLIDPGDADALASAIQRVVLDADLRASLRKSAHDYLLRTGNGSTPAIQHLRFITNLLHGGDRRSRAKTGYESD